MLHAPFEIVSYHKYNITLDASFQTIIQKVFLFYSLLVLQFYLNFLPIVLIEKVLFCPISCFSKFGKKTNNIEKEKPNPNPYPSVIIGFS